MDKFFVFCLSMSLAAILFSVTTVFAAEQAVNVTTTDNQTEEVPTLTTAIQNSITAITALVTAILALAGLILKSGLLDRWVSRKRQNEIYNSVQMNFLNLKKVIEDKALQKHFIEMAIKDIPEEQRAKYIPMINQLQQSIDASIEQLKFYAEKWNQYVKPDQFSRISPDYVPELPRETGTLPYELQPIPKKITPETSRI